MGPSSQLTRKEIRVAWGNCRKDTNGMEARAAVISTGLVVDDLDQAFQMRGWRDLETTRNSTESDSRTKRSLP